MIARLTSKLTLGYKVFQFLESKPKGELGHPRPLVVGLNLLNQVIDYGHCQLSKRIVWSNSDSASERNRKGSDQGIHDELESIRASPGSSKKLRRKG